MIWKKSELPVTQHHGFRGGQGDLIWQHFLSQDDACCVGRLFCKSILPPGASIGIHKHEGDFEIYYILSGIARITDGKQIAILEPGDVNLCRDGDVHGIENIGEQDLEYISLILFTPRSKA